MTPLLGVLIAYAVGLILLGVWIGRRVRKSADFFVGGRSLGPGLIFATFLAANIGAGSTVGATGNAYHQGFAAWWWNGSAGLGSLVLAFWIGPRIWREAKRLNFLTVGDFLEHHFGRDGARPRRAHHLVRQPAASSARNSTAWRRCSTSPPACRIRRAA